jgi:hypothetical protein
VTPSVLGKLGYAVDDLIGVIPPLEHAVAAQQASRKSEGRRPRPGSRPPWNVQAAVVAMDVHHGSRELEQDMRYSVTGTMRPRGDSDANTVAALNSVLSLAPAAGYGQQCSALRKITGWTWRARVVLGEAEPLQRIPVEKGHPEPRCPFCKFATLRVRPAAGQVLCVNPEDVDDDGNRRVAVIEIGGHFGEPLFIWNDNQTIGLAV